MFEYEKYYNYNYEYGVFYPKMLLNYERKLMESLERPAVVSDTIPGHCSCLQTDQSEKGMRRWGTIADQDSGHCLVSRDCNGILIGQRKT